MDKQLESTNIDEIDYNISKLEIIRELEQVKNVYDEFKVNWDDNYS